MTEIINIDNHKAGPDKIWVLSKESNSSNDENKKNTVNYKISSNKIDNHITSIDVRKYFVLKISKTIFSNFQNLSSINLSNNCLVKISEHFKKLKNLKVIRLDNNYITDLPSFIGKMEKLEVISVCSNLIEKVPTSLQYLSNLTQLKLSRNKIRILPIEFGLLKSLEILHIDSNYFIEIPTTMCYLKNMKEFCFEWLEYTEPAYQKHLKEGIGFTIISFIRKSLQDLIKLGILYCPFKLFIEMNSQDNFNDKNMNKTEEDKKLASDKENNNNLIKVIEENSKILLDANNHNTIEYKENFESTKNNQKQGCIEETNNKDFYEDDEELTKEYNETDQDKDFNIKNNIKKVTKLTKGSIKRKQKGSFNYQANNEIQNSDQIQAVKKIEINDSQFNDKEEIIKKKASELTTIKKNYDGEIIKDSCNNLNERETTEKKIAINTNVDNGILYKRKKYLRIFNAIENDMFGVVKVDFYFSH